MPNMTDIKIIQSQWNQAWSLLPITNNVDKTHVGTTLLDLAQKFCICNYEPQIFLLSIP